MTKPMSDERLAEIRIVRDLTPVSLEAREALTELLAEVERLRDQSLCDGHCAEVERERDEYLVELEQFRHEKAEREARRSARRGVDIGTGHPHGSHLEAFGQQLLEAFGTMPYHVGSSVYGKTWRDVDVRIMLDDDRFDALFPGYATFHRRDAWWSLICTALSVLGEQRTGLPVDCQIQRTSEANEAYPGARNPLFLRRAEDDHRPTMMPGAGR